MPGFELQLTAPQADALPGELSRLDLVANLCQAVLATGRGRSVESVDEWIGIKAVYKVG